MYRETQKVLFENDAGDKISEGINLLADAVAVTLGPGGRHVAYETAPGFFSVTKDGVTVARAFKKLEDPFKEVGVQLVRQAAQRTVEIAGDGTTTSTVLARDLYNQGREALADGYNVTVLSKGIDKAVSLVVDKISDLSTPINTKEELHNVAIISTNNDKELGTQIADTFDRLGNKAAITVEMGRQSVTTVEYYGGLKIDSGFSSSDFVTDSKSNRVTFDNPYIMIVSYKLNTFHEMLNILEKVRATGRPLLIIAKHYSADVLNILAINNRKGIIPACLVPFPMGFDEDYTELGKDLAAATGATVLGHTGGVDASSCDLSHLGTANSVVVTRNHTILVQGGGTQQEVEKRIKQIQDYREMMKNDPRSEKLLVYLDGRIAQLKGGIAVIRAGGLTEMAMKETKDRIDDAVAAVSAATEEGIVPGGGTALAHLFYDIDSLASLETDKDMKKGILIVRDAILAPLRQIANNSGYDPNKIVKKVVNEGKGFNAVSGQFEDMVAAGIIDPAKVVKTAIKNAASVATLLLTTEAVIVTDVIPLGSTSQKNSD